MKKQLVIIGIVAILVIVGLSGCNSTEQTNEQELTNETEQNNEQPVTNQKKIIGFWWNESYDGDETTYTFYDNGSVNQTWNARTDWYDYSITGDKLIIGNDVYKFSISDDNKKLILGDIVYQRQ